MTPSDILEQFAATRRAVEQDVLPPNVGALFDQAVTRFADRTLWVGIEGSEETFTYRAFGAQVNRCTDALAGFGVGLGTHVAIMLPPTSAFVITWMALAKLGAVMIPINPELAPVEVERILSTSEAGVLVGDPHALTALRAAVPEPSVPRSRTIVLDGPVRGCVHDWRMMLAAGDPAPRPLPDVEPDRLLSLQFTSGSTGTPKGCMLTHRYWVTIGRVRMSQGPAVQRMLIDMPFHYMGGQWRFLMALQLGATVFVAGQLSLSRFLDRLIAHRIDFCTVTSAIAKLPDDPRYSQLALRWALVAGLNKDLHAELEARLRAPVREMYGLTETGSVLGMPMEATHMVGSGSCGLPVAYRECRIAHPEGNEVATGESGELWIAGPAMFDGYYKRPDLDAQVRSGKWFRTGDLFRKDRDGYHFMLGRMKDLIRRSGENIAAGDIEAVLQGMPEVLEAAAVPVADPVRGEEVKVVVALKPGLRPEDVPPDRIMAFCRTRLARFKLPRYVAYVGEMPKTASGKIAKQELRSGDGRHGSYDFADNRWR